MKVALFSVHTSPTRVPGQGDAGGMNVVVSEAARALSALGHSVVVVTRATSHDRGEPQLLDAASNIPVLSLEVGAPHLSKHELPALMPAFAEAFLRHPLAAGTDIVHGHYWVSGVAALEVGKARGIPVVSSLHTVAAQKNALLAPGATREPATRLNAEAQLAAHTTIVAGSHSEFEAIASGYGTPRAASRVIHPGVDTTLFHPAPAPAVADSLSQPPLQLLVLGRVQPLKGQDLAIEAFDELHRRYPEIAQRASLTIAGEPTPGAEMFHVQLLNRARELGHDIRFLPAQTRAQAAELFRQCDLTLVPSHSETFGLVALESAASGTPVIASRTSGLLEATSEGESGLLVTGRNPADWADAIAQLVLDRNRFDALRSSARTFAGRHSWAHHAQALTKLYASLT